MKRNKGRPFLPLLAMMLALALFSTGFAAPTDVGNAKNTNEVSKVVLNTTASPPVAAVKANFAEQNDAVGTVANTDNDVGFVNKAAPAVSNGFNFTEKANLTQQANSANLSDNSATGRASPVVQTITNDVNLQAANYAVPFGLRA